MSYAVARGQPLAAQLYLDGIIDEVLRCGVSAAGGREGVSLPQILFYCLRKNPNDVFMINAASGKKITNAEILSQAVSLTRALISKGARGRNVMIMMKNHQTMVAVYFASFFAGTVPFIMDPYTTVFEIKHFLKLIEPCIVFCDDEYYNDVSTALQGIPVQTEVWVSNDEELLKEITNGFSDDAENFLIPDVDVDAAVMMAPTSGSTGLPKATLLTHRGLVVQLPTSWCYHTQFPSPTECCMLLTTPQWVTFTMMVTSCLVYRVPLLMSQKKPTVDWVKEMLLTYRPSWTFFGPAFAKTLLPTLTRDHLSSLKTLYLLGAPSSMELKTAFREILPASALLGDVYGSTEMQGYITITVPGAPLECTGKVVNIFDYKLVDDDGKTVGLGETGELYVKGLSTFKGYFKNQDAFDESFSDGWFMTGDLFRVDQAELLYYVQRKKFSFKYLGSHVSPEEVELVIGSVAGVEESVVSATERGPAALVVASGVSRNQIHQAVNDTLSEHKHLHGGVAFVPALPHTHSGKIQRMICSTLIQDLIKSGECY